MLYSVITNIIILSFTLILPSTKLGEEGNNKLLMINSRKVKQLSQIWIYDMANSNKYYPKFMYMDLIKERDQNFNDPLHHYISYYNKNSKLNDHPEYIGALVLDPKYRNFNLHRIIQNPNYDEETALYKFILELEELSYDCNVSLTIENLKNFSNSRYWLSINNYF